MGYGNKIDCKPPSFIGRTAVFQAAEESSILSGGAKDEYVWTLALSKSLIQMRRSA